MKSEEAMNRFLDDVKTHEMKIIKDDGVYRSILFKRPDSGTYWFEITTWNRYLCISGDMGCYVFSRIEDMFDFFRMDDNDFNKDRTKELNINAGYWGEKLQSIGRNAGYKEFSEEVFERNVKECFDQYYEDEEDQAKKDECWEEIERWVLGQGESEEQSMKNAMDFDFKDFTLTDFWEYDCKTYTIHYLWALYAIVWGIQKYEASKVKA